MLSARNAWRVVVRAPLFPYVVVVSVAAVAVAVAVPRVAGAVATPNATAVLQSADLGVTHGTGQPQIPTSYPTGPGPAMVTVGPNGRLVYQPDRNGDTIPDFSSVGYRGGGVPIPDVPVVTTLTPPSGDARPPIQRAIDDLAAKPLGPDGFRGAILLKKGRYTLSTGGLVVRASGIVLRGEGDGPDETVLRLTKRVNALTVEPAEDGRTTQESERRMADDYVPVGATWFRLESAAGLAVGDRVIVTRPSTANWLKDIGMSWKPGSINIGWDRRIIAVDGDRVMVDAPITQGLDRKYGGGYLRRVTSPERFTRVGLEHMRVYSTVDVDELGNTGGSLVTMRKLTDGWVRGVTNANMRGHATLIRGSKRITVEDVTSFHHPVPGRHSGASIQINTFSYSQLLLFQRITSSDGGFEFSSGPLNPGPNVVVDSKVPHGFAATSPHMKWSVGTLYDNLDLNQGLSIQRHDGSHGFAAANHVVWNTRTTKSLSCDRPPTAHQWIIGSTGSGPVKGPREGALECEVISYGVRVKPDSLYRAQLKQRLDATTGRDTPDSDLCPTLRLPD